MFFPSRPNSVIRGVSSGFCLAFIKLPQAGAKQSSAAPLGANIEEDGLAHYPEGLSLSPSTAFFGELCFRDSVVMGTGP